MKLFGVIWSGIIAATCLALGLYYGLYKQDVFKMVILYALANIQIDMMNWNRGDE